MDRQDRISQNIRAKLLAGQILLIYADTRTVRTHGGDGTLCRGCDEPISEVDLYSIGYQVPRGGRHWFHVVCDAIRAKESATLTMNLMELS